MNLQEAAEKIVKECMNVKKGEKVLIITDKNKMNIAKAIADEAEKITTTKLVEIPVGQTHGEEPSDEIAKEMKESDIVIIPTSKSLSHTKARRDASEAGARITTMPGVIEEIIQRCIDIDYYKLKELHANIRKELIDSKEVRVVTELGTDVRMVISEVHGETAGLIHEKGFFCNLPTGEVDSGVKKDSTNGVIVVDASFSGIGKLESPLTLIVENGYVVSIEGERADELKELLDPLGEDAYKIAEFGIGTNPNAIVSGNILEDEKVLGTVHFAVGNDMTYGGGNDVAIHLDGIINKPTIYIDKKMIMEKGEMNL